MKDHIKKIKAYSKSIIDKKLNRIKKTFINVPIIKSKNGYPYSFFTLTDFEPAMEPSLIEDMADLLIYFGSFEKADIIVSEADRGGGPLAHAVAIRANIPYTLANWYPIKSESGQSIRASVGFSGEGSIYLHGLQNGQKVIVLDDLLSSGGTADALIKGVLNTKSKILETWFVAEKVTLGGRKKLESEYQFPIKSLVKFCSTDTVTRECL